jgi:hypothetical protein
MAILNRTLDQSQQRAVMSAAAGAVATGVTGVIGVVPYPCFMEAGEIAAFGISGTPNYAVVVNRFIPGAGATAITVAVGTSNAPLAFGTSGAIAMAISASTQLLANDVLMYQSGGTTSAVTGLAIGVVLRPIQDIKIHFGQV